MSTFYYLTYASGSCIGFYRIEEAEDSAVNIALHFKENVEIWRGKVEDISGDIHLASVPYSLAKQAWQNYTTNLSLVEMHFPDAYKALPEPYKNDSCLSFYLCEGLGGEQELRARHDLGGTFAFRGMAWVEICDACECLYISDESYDGYPRCQVCNAC